MEEWISNSIIEGTDGLGESLTYERALSNIKNMMPSDYSKIKERVDQILISKGRSDLIKK